MTALYITLAALYITLAVIAVLGIAGYIVYRGIGSIVEIFRDLLITAITAR